MVEREVIPLSALRSHRRIATIKFDVALPFRSRASPVDRTLVAQVPLARRLDDLGESRDLSSHDMLRSRPAGLTCEERVLRDARQFCTSHLRDVGATDAYTRKTASPAGVGRSCGSPYLNTSAASVVAAV